jgi:acetone monooxygenase (methyl acetate-forming)
VSVTEIRTGEGPEQVDAVVVGAGLNGIYQLYRLVQQGLKVRAFEAGDGVGGVWYWNRYPGARCDSHFPFYQYWFSKALWNETRWSQRFPGQVDIERYFNAVCDRFDLKRHIIFGTRVTAARFEEATGRWIVSTDTGETVSAQFLVLNTGHWPREGVALAGKRVGVIGTAATGIQVIQTIAAEVAQLVVFQRTANYAVAMRNDAITDADRAAARDAYEDLRERAHHSFGGFVYNDTPPMFDDVPPEERQARMEEVWAAGSLKFWGGAFADAFSNPEAAECLSEFVRGKIRARVKDPVVAEKLTPRDYQFGTRRVPLENGYFDVFNRDNVELVDLKADPIVSIDETGINTATGHHDLDVIIYATGFDAGVGAFNQIDIRGRGGESLREQWKRAVRTTVGMQAHGFPNMFMTMAPFAPASALCNVPICTDQQVDWISDAIAFVRAKGLRTLEPSAETEEAWMTHHTAVSEPTLLGQNRNSWYRLQDEDGRRRELLAYVGGIDHYRSVCDQFRASGYQGFDLT